MKALIVGFGKSGQSAKKFLKKRQIECEIASENDINSGEKLKNIEYADRLFSGLSFIVKSPGVLNSSPLLMMAKRRKIKIIGEFELGALSLKGDIIAVTGTNGKTTTVSIIYHLLKFEKKDVFLAGNTNFAVSSIADETAESSINILEASSFQLENIKNFKPHIAAILNFAPDHLNHHKNFKEYIKAKQNITKFQTKNDYLLINFDDEMLMKNLPKTKAKIYYFSTKNKVNGCYVSGGNIYFNDGENENKLVSLKNIKLAGEHNLSNILCAILACHLQTKKQDFLSNISSFHGVPHRIEFVKNVGGVSYYNDSKATNIASTIVATKAFKNNINLILGGSDKGYDFETLFLMLPANVVFVSAFGETAEIIEKSAKKVHFGQITIAKTLKEAVFLCKSKAKENEIILLSPACASFDQFKNFEERGNVFKKIVEEIFENEDVVGDKK